MPRPTSQANKYTHNSNTRSQKTLPRECFRKCLRHSPLLFWFQVVRILERLQKTLEFVCGEFEAQVAGEGLVEDDVGYG